MKIANIYKKENWQVIFKKITYTEIIFKETYVIIKGLNQNHIIRNFENIICDSDDFWDLEKI